VFSQVSALLRRRSWIAAMAGACREPSGEPAGWFTSCRRQQMDVLGCPRKDIAVTLSWYRREHRRRRPAPDRRLGAWTSAACCPGHGAQIVQFWTGL